MRNNNHFYNKPANAYGIRWITGVFILIAAILLTHPAAESRGFPDSAVSLGSYNLVAGPTLLYPVTDDIKIPANGSLEFKWEKKAEIGTAYYIFKLYKGYKTITSALILEKKILPEEYPFSLAASQLEEGQVYTWTLMQVAYGGSKSDKSYSSFKIQKQ